MSYRIPIALWSDEDDARLEHEDLPHLDVDDLQHEAARVLGALERIGPRDTDREWLLTRLRRVRVEIRTRNDNGRRARAAGSRN